MRLFKDASYDFLNARRKAYVFSGAVLAVGIFSLVAHKGLSYGVEFTGGTLLQVEIAEGTSVGQLRDVLSGGGYANAQIQGFGGGVNEYLIRFQEREASPPPGPGAAAAADGSGQGDDQRLAGASSVAEQLVGSLEEEFGTESVTVQRTSAVSPQVSEELQRKALVAILLSFLFTLVYLAFRFEWRFGVAAVIATVHDILITFGFVSVMEIEITLATVAAILTIIGYSLNDTIVIFDRIRENLKERRKESYIDVLNRSINETLPRTAMTSLTTLATLFALFLFGGAVIRPFAMVLILGVAIGTYSSVFVASPALLEIDEYLKQRAQAQRQAA